MLPTWLSFLWSCIDKKNSLMLKDDPRRIHISGDKKARVPRKKDVRMR